MRLRPALDRRPEDRLALAGSVASRTDHPRAPLDRPSESVASGPKLVVLSSTASPTAQRGSRPCAAPCSSCPDRPSGAGRPRRLLHSDPHRPGCPRLHGGVSSARSRTSSTSLAPSYLALQRSTDVERLVRSSPRSCRPVDVAGGYVLDRSARGPVRPMSATLTLDVITIFPEYLAPLRQALLGRAIDRGQVAVNVHDLRTWTEDVHRTVDDTPYGGGPGMVMLPEPWGRALDTVAPAGRDPAAANRPHSRWAPVHPGDRGRTRRRAVAGLRLRPLRGHRRACGRVRGPANASRGNQPR